MIKIPAVYYIVAVAVFIVLMLWKKKWDLALLASYMFLVFAYTVLDRRVRRVLVFGMEPFWSYKAIFAGGYSPVPLETLLIQMIANVVMFIPIGFLAARLLRWKGIILGLGFSVMIELLQLIMNRGLFEFDDILHNTIGVMIGFGIVCLYRRIKGYDV